MHHYVTEMCTCVHISLTNWCIVGYGTRALCDLCDRSSSALQLWAPWCKKNPWKLDIIFWAVWSGQVQRKHQSSAFLILMMTSLNGHFPLYSPFVRGLVDSPHEGQCRGASMFSLICTWTTGWANIRGAGDLRRLIGHYNVTVMYIHWFLAPRYPSISWRHHELQYTKTKMLSFSRNISMCWRRIKKAPPAWPATYPPYRLDCWFQLVDIIQKLFRLISTCRKGQCISEKMSLKGRTSKWQMSGNNAGDART